MSFIQYNQNRDLAGRLPVDAFVKTETMLGEAREENTMMVDQITSAIRSQPVAPEDEWLREEKLQDIQKQIEGFSQSGKDLAGAKTFVSKLASKHLSDPEWVAAQNNYKMYSEDQAFRNEALRKGIPTYDVPNNFQGTVTEGPDGRQVNEYSPGVRAFGDFASGRDAVFNDFKGEKRTVMGPNGEYVTTDSLTPESVLEYVSSYGMDQYRGSQEYKQEMVETMATNPDITMDEADSIIQQRLTTHGMEKAYQNQTMRQGRQGTSGKLTPTAIRQAFKNVEIASIEPTKGTGGSVQYNMWWDDNDIEVPFRERSNAVAKNKDKGYYEPMNNWYRVTGAGNNNAFSPGNVADASDEGDELDWNNVQSQGFVTGYVLGKLPDHIKDEGIGDNNAKTGHLLAFGHNGTVPHDDSGKGDGNRIHQDEETGEYYVFLDEEKNHRVEVVPRAFEMMATGTGGADGESHVILEELTRAQAAEVGFIDYMDDMFVPGAGSGQVPIQPNEKTMNSWEWLQNVAATDPTGIGAYVAPMLDQITAINRGEIQLSDEELQKTIREINMNMKTIETIASHKNKRYTK